MKNNLLIALGLLVAFGSAAGIVSASRDAYHNYQYQEGYYARNYESQNPENLAVRPSTNRVTGWQTRANRFAETQAKKETPKQVSVRPERNYRGSRAQADWADERSLVVRNNTSNRHFARREGRWQALSTTTRSAVSFRNIPEGLNGKSFEADSYLVSFPDSFEIVAHEESLVAKDDIVNVTVTKIDNSCGDSGFFFCGTTLSKNLNGYGKNEIRSMSRINRSSIKTYKYLGDNRLTQTYTESFAAITEGNEIFVVRYFVADEAGNLIYIIEGKAPLTNGADLVASAKKIFDSFHVKAIEAQSKEVAGTDEEGERSEETERQE